MKYFLTILTWLGCFFCKLNFAAINFIDSAKPPPGFENLEQHQELQVALWFMHQYVGMFYVRIIGDKLTFYNPNEIVQSIKKINKVSVLKLLQQPLPLNVHCDEFNQNYGFDCAKLTKKPMYIIYHPETQKADLHLNSRLFKKNYLDNQIGFISPSNSDWSYLNRLGATGSFNNEQPFFNNFLYPSLANYYNLYSNNILAYKNNSLIANLSQNSGLNQQTHFQIQNLYGQHINRDKIYTAGYVINPSSPFFQTQILAGAGVRTTLDTLKNSNNFTAIPLMIFVPQASQVSIFRNEQLIFSQYLEAGYQTINTQNFPEGGYELVIKIGSSTVMRQFFFKGLSLPPKELPQYYVMGGYLTNGLLVFNQDYNFLPKVFDIPVLQTGVNYRITQQSAFFSDLLITSHQGLMDFGGIFSFKNALLTIAGLATTNGNYGAYSSFNIQKSQLNFNLITTRIFYQQPAKNYFFLNNIIDNDSASIVYQLTQKDTLGIQANYNRVLNQGNNYNINTFYQRKLGDYQGLGLFFNAIYSKILFVGDSYSLNLTLNFSHDNVAGTESIGWQRQANPHYYNRLAAPIVAQGNTTYSHQDEQGLGYSVNEIHTLSPTVTSVAGTYNYTAKQGLLASYINYNQIKNQAKSIEYGGSAETEIALNSQAFKLNGFNRNQQAGIMVQVDAQSLNSNTKFALLDEQQRRVAIIEANKSTFIPLPAFTDQTFHLVNLSNQAYSIEKAYRRVTLYPGNINDYRWQAQKKIIVIGQIFYHNSPLANVWIHQANNGIFSDEQGNFQLELMDNDKELQAGNLCHITLPSLNSRKAYVYLGKLTCL